MMVEAARHRPQYAEFSKIRAPSPDSFPIKDLGVRPILVPRITVKNPDT